MPHKNLKLVDSLVLGQVDRLDLGWFDMEGAAGKGDLGLAGTYLKEAVGKDAGDYTFVDKELVDKH